jgi:predicted Zn-dependent protease
MKIGAKPQPDPVGFFMSLVSFIVAGVLYLLSKRREAPQSVQIATSQLDEQHVAQAQQHTRRQKLILILVVAGAGIALPFFLIPRLPPRGRHEYLLEGQVVSIALDRKEASIKHDAINGFRPATTMSYNVANAGELAALKPGDLITATLVVVRDDIHLDDIKKVVAAAELDPLAPTLKEGWERPAAPPNDLYLVAVGDVPPALMSSLVAGAEQTLGIQVAVLRPLSVDRTMYDPARSQLIADELIAAVRSGYPTLARNPRARVIAITAQDMYIKARRETWRYAFSHRSNENSLAVVSYARMDPAYPWFWFLGNTPDEELLRSRLRKMVIKNIGIMYYGLPVSRDPRSVLYGNVLGLDDLDYMSEFFEPRQ